MVTNGTLMVKDRKGNIYTESLDKLEQKHKTLQTLSMNRHGHETYTFALIEVLRKTKNEDTYLYRIETINSLDQKKTITCSSSTQVFTRGQRWTGFTSVDKLHKNSILVDDEDRSCRITNISRIDSTDAVYDINVMFTGNFFINGLLVR